MSSSRKLSVSLGQPDFHTPPRRGGGGGMGKSRLQHQGSGVASLKGSVMSASSKKSNFPSTNPYEKVSSARFPIKVFNEAGEDVTPLPLVALDPNQLRISVGGDTAISSPTDVLSQLSVGGVGSVFGGGAFSRSVFTPSYDTGSTPDEEGGGVPSTWAEIRQERAKVQLETLTQKDLHKEIVICLEETNTIWMLDTPTVCVPEDSPDAENISLDNSIYAKLCKSRAGNDLYAERGMNTFNEAPKTKAMQCVPVPGEDKGVVCTNYDMYDTYAALEAKAKEKTVEEVDDVSGRLSEKDLVRQKRDQSTRSSMCSMPRSRHTSVQKNTSSAEEGKTKSRKGSEDNSSSPALSVMLPSNDTEVATVASDVSSLDEDRILKLEALRKDLFVMERVINLNSYQSKQAVYREFDVLQDMDSEKMADQITMDGLGPNLTRLWSYSCPATKGRNVACLAWNKINPDLVAVGYGQFEFTAQKSGLICCWCLKNPEFPERIYNCKYGVTALDFSAGHPNILAAGFYDGGVALYTMHSTDNEPLLDSQEDRSSSSDSLGESDSHNRHMGPVWQLQWVDKEKLAGEETAEVLISVSTDGHVMQWTVRNGFECYDIMRLKKSATRMSKKQKGGDKKDEAIISRYAGGFCFDFDVDDSSMYLVGTEDGYIHMCSCSYQEQFLETYSGHTGPVYRVRWSPFVNSIFLSCSADWTLCLWHKDRSNPVLKFHSSTKQVYDVCWSPRCSTVFACVNEGSVEVWDLAQSTLDPVIVVCPTYAVKLSSVFFANNTDCILVGDSEGQVTVYELRCMPEYPSCLSEQVQKLTDMMKDSLASHLSCLDLSKAVGSQKGQDHSKDAAQVDDGLAFEDSKLEEQLDSM